MHTATLAPMQIQPPYLDKYHNPPLYVLDSEYVSGTYDHNSRGGQRTLGPQPLSVSAYVRTQQSQMVSSPPWILSVRYACHDHLAPL